jgi:hypothetical protein
MLTFHFSEKSPDQHHFTRYCMILRLNLVDLDLICTYNFYILNFS